MYDELQNVPLPICLNSPIFENMRLAFDAQLANVMSELFEENFDGGEINLKLAIEIELDHEDIAESDGFEGHIKQDIFFKKPVFKHTIMANFKRNSKIQGVYDERRQLKINADGLFIAAPVNRSQMSIDDVEETAIRAAAEAVSSNLRELKKAQKN
jgi:hypothetical protein